MKFSIEKRKDKFGQNDLYHIKLSIISVKSLSFQCDLKRFSFWHNVIFMKFEGPKNSSTPERENKWGLLALLKRARAVS